MEDEAQPTAEPLQRRCQGSGREWEDECPRPGIRRCAACKKVYYCSKECQVGHWNFHIFDCKPHDKISSAHFLWRACLRDLIPTEPHALEDFGFNRVQSTNVVMLFGLYRGLLVFAQPAPIPRDLDTWRKEGTLVEHIKDVFERIPEHARGDYYRWFLQNQWVLDGSPRPPGHTAEALASSLDASLWAFLGPVRKAESANWTRDQNACANHYRLLLSQYRPPPHMPTEFIHFGYCTAAQGYEEHELTGLYRTLIRRCTFEEFCDAYKSSALVSLMKAKGVYSVAPTRHFEHVMSTSPRSNESVWNLKVYLEGGYDEPVPSICVDYGLANCRTEEELRELGGFYKKIFDSHDFDPMELHAHCIQGRLLEYAERFHKLKKDEKKKFKRLLKNPYPLPESAASVQLQSLE